MKTLHPGVHGGILARRDLPAHMSAIEQHGIATIDLVIVNLYPFRQTVTAATKPTYEARGLPTARLASLAPAGTHCAGCTRARRLAPGLPALQPRCGSMQGP